MKTTIMSQLFSTSLVCLFTVLIQPSRAENDTHFVPLRIAWVDKPPYLTAPTNESLDHGPLGLIRDALMRHITIECGYYAHVTYNITNVKVTSESAMIEPLRNGEAQAASPIFVNPNNRRYTEFPFFKLVVYPGTEFITADENADQAKVVLDAVVKAWPLLAVTIVLTAIAGVIIWALDTYWNVEEFPRSFLRGSWDGFWWSYISMTTVGYGDKAPKSIIARVFAMVWIQLGLIVMAIFTASVTSALTAVSLELEPNDLVGKEVAVFRNETEYQHALEEQALPKVYNRIDDIIGAVKAGAVDGMPLDRYTASHYQKMGKLKSLITVKMLELSRDAGMSFAPEYHSLVECLNFHRSAIWKSAQALTENLKLTQQKPAKQFSMFDESGSAVESFLYISLGGLAVLLVIGVLWEVFCRKKSKSMIVRGATINEGMTMKEKTSVYEDLEEGKRLVKQLQDHFDMLQTKVPRL